MNGLSATTMRVMMFPSLRAPRNAHHAEHWIRTPRLPGRLPTRRGLPLKESGNPAPPQVVDWNSLILRVAADADRAAFEQLFRHFGPRIKAYLMRGGADAGLAEELAQEALLVLWRKAAYFDPARAGASTWIFTIARNLRIDRARRDLVKARVPEDPSDEPPPPAGADELIAAGQRDDRVRQLVEGLPAEQAEIVRLSFFSEKPQTQIAETLGIPLGTVKSRVRLAMARLRAALEEVER